MAGVAQRPVGYRTGIGAFAAVATPQQPDIGASVEFLGGLTAGDPGLRLASSGAGASGGRRRWLSGIVTIQRFVRAGASHEDPSALGSVNSEDSLSTLPLQRRGNRSLNSASNIPNIDLG